MYLDTSTGDLLVESNDNDGADDIGGGSSSSMARPDLVSDVCGGLFCDEPGLGKTVTALSLVLRTRGRMAQRVPTGAVVVHTQDRHGRPAAYYHLPQPLLSERTGPDVGSPPPAAGKSQTQHQQQQQQTTTTATPLLPPSPPVINLPAQTAATSPSSTALDHLPPTQAAPQQQPLPGDASAAGGEGGEVVWVQCDSCNKWRRLPPGHQVTLNLLPCYCWCYWRCLQLWMFLCT